MLESTGSGGRTLPEVVQGQEHFADGRNSDVRSAKRASSCSASRYGVAQRYAYIQEARTAFRKPKVLSLVADAVHVGSDDWLNVFLYEHNVGLVFVCPPQASRMQ